MESIPKLWITLEKLSSMGYIQKKVIVFLKIMIGCIFQDYLLKRKCTLSNISYYNILPDTIRLTKVVQSKSLCGGGGGS